MTMSSSVVPQKSCGLRVLLVDSNRMSLQVHANLLNQNSYRVTITTEASKGLSMIMDGHTYDCVLIDADICKKDMDAFLHQVLKHRPQMSIILMASDDIYLRIQREVLESEAVHCLLKPCCPTDICNIWKHISRNRSSFKENFSIEKLHTENQVDNNVMRDDPRVKPPAINGRTVINNNISSGNFTEQVTNGDLFPNDDKGNADDQEDVHEITPKENIGTCTTKKADKGKQPLIPVEDDKLSKKRKEFKTRISWRGELEEKFINALRELGPKAQSSTILQHMNVPGLTRHHVASHLQKHHKRRKLIEDSIAKSFANERWQSTQSNDSASIIQSSSLLKLPALNLAGILYVVIAKIVARLLEARPLPVPHPTTTPSNNYCGDQATDHSYRVVESSSSGGQGTEIQLRGQVHENSMEPQVTGELSLHHPLGEAMAPLGVENSNIGGQGNEIQLRGQVHENAMDPQVPGELSSHHPFGEAIAPLGVENSNNGGQGTEVQLKGHGYGNAMEPQVTTELASCHAFGETVAPLGVESFNNVGQGIEVQLKGHGYGNAMEPQVTCEISSYHAFGEAVAPSGVENFNNGGQGTELQLIGQNYGNAMEQQVTSEISSYHAFGEATAPFSVENSNNGGQRTEYQLIGQDYENAMEPQVTREISSCHAFGESVASLGVENSNNGGQGIEHQLMGHDYGNEMEPRVTSEISSYHAFGEAVAPSGVENSNNGGQGTEYQLVGQNYGNEMEPQVTSEISSYHAFGEATAPLSVEDYNYDGQGIEIQLIGNEYGNAMEPQVTAEASSHHADGEVMAPLGVGANAASDNNLGMDVNSLHSSLNNRNFGDASGSGLGEVQVQVSCSGPATDPCVADCEGDAALLNDSLEGLGWPDFFSFDAEGRLCPSYVNRENLGLVSPRSAAHLNVENQINPGSNPDSIPIQPASAGFPFPEFRIEEDDSLAQTQLPVNSGVPLDGSQARFIDNDLSQSDIDNAMSLFDDDDGYLFGGPFYF